MIDKKMKKRFNVKNTKKCCAKTRKSKPCESPAMKMAGAECTVVNQQEQKKRRNRKNQKS